MRKEEGRGKRIRKSGRFRSRSAPASLGTGFRLRSPVVRINGRNCVASIFLDALPIAPTAPRP